MCIGRSTSRAAERISDDLRRGDGRLPARRRAVAGLSLVAVGAMSAVSLYQMGILKHLSRSAATVDELRQGRCLRRGLRARLDAGLHAGVASYAVTLALLFAQSAS